MSTPSRNRLYLSAALFMLAAGTMTTATANWSEFRGPSGDGVVQAPKGKPLGLPLRWSETENVVWKVETPGKGWSTPVVLCNQVWSTTATPDGHDYFVIRVDGESGGSGR